MFNLSRSHCCSRHAIWNFIPKPRIVEFLWVVYEFCSSTLIRLHQQQLPVSVKSRWCWRLSDSQSCVLIRNECCSSLQTCCSVSRPGNLRPLAEWPRLSCCSCRSAGIRCCLQRPPPLQVETEPTVRDVYRSRNLKINAVWSYWNNYTLTSNQEWRLKNKPDQVKRFFRIKGSDLQSGQEGCERSWPWPFRGHSNPDVPSLSSPLSGSRRSPWSDHNICAWVKY